MYKVMLCKRCGCFGLVLEETMCCPVCQNRIFEPHLTEAEFERMSDLEQDAYPFQFQSADKYDPVWWRENKLRDARHMVAVNGIGDEYGPPKKRGILEWGIF